MTQPLLIALDMSILIWIGMWILLKKRYKWFTILMYIVLTFLFTYYGFIFLEQGIRPIIFIFIFVISNFRKNGWGGGEIRENFFHISLVFMINMLSRTWSNFVMYHITGYYTVYDANESHYLVELYSSPLSLLIKSFIFIGLLFCVRSGLKKIKFTTFMEQVDTIYGVILSAGTGLLFICYGITLFLPIILGITCSGMILIQAVYMTMLAFISLGLVVLFSVILKKEIALIEKKETASKLEEKICNYKAEVLELEAQIESLDRIVVNSNAIQQKLRDFNHGENEFILALAGVFESGDKEAMYEILKQYKKEVTEMTQGILTYSEIGRLKSSELFTVRKVLLAKIAKANDHSIKFTLEIPVEIEELGIPALKFIEILGVWLENAIEEAMLTEEKWVHTSFILDEKIDGPTALEFRVSNSCRKEIISFNTLSKRGFTTKGEGRGNGLPIVETVTDKYENIFAGHEYKDGKFIQTLEIEFHEIKDNEE